MSIQRGPKPEEADNGPPAWIVSFSDMVTLLLAFFVMLQAFAHMQDPALFFVGRDAFKRAIAGLGIPGWLLGKPENIRHEYHKTKYSTEPAKHKIPKNRVLDVEDEKIRQAFADMKQDMETRASDVMARLVDRRVLSLGFLPGAQALDPESKRELTALAVSMKQNMRYRPVTVYVIGLATGPGPALDQLRVSAQRARGVCRFLRESCAAAIRQSGWRVVSWGAGAGGKWLETLGGLPRGANTIVIITEKE